MAEQGASGVVMTPAIQVRPLPVASFAVLRLGAAQAGAVIAAASAALGAALPTTPNRAAGEAPRALWTGPLEWTLVGSPPERLSALEAALAGSIAHLANLTDGRVGFRIAGPAAAELIESECPLDLHALAPGDCAQSLFAGVGVLIERREGEDGFRLYADASLAAHLEAWLAAVAEGLAGRGSGDSG